MSLFDINYLMVYNNVPSSLILSNLLGMVMLWATDFFPLWKKVSGVQILLAIRLLRGKTFIGPWNFNLSSFQACLKKTSMVYSWGKRRCRQSHCCCLCGEQIQQTPILGWKMWTKTRWTLRWHFLSYATWRVQFGHRVTFRIQLYLFKRGSLHSLLVLCNSRCLFPKLALRQRETHDP